ncbi:MAG: hypothetical protein QM651_15120 [Rhodoblastus sp.]
MSRGPIISDHALLRFFERAGGLDVEAVRLMLSRSLERAKKAATNIGGGDYTIKADGLIYIVVDNRVVTTFADTGAPVVHRSRGRPE